MGIQDRSIEKENVKDMLANQYAIQGNLTKRYQISISRANPTSWPWYSLCVTLLLITRRYFREHGGKLKWPTIASIELYEVLKERIPRNPRLPLHFKHCVHSRNLSSMNGGVSFVWSIWSLCKKLLDRTCGNTIGEAHKSTRMSLPPSLRSSVDGNCSDVTRILFNMSSLWAVGGLATLSWGSAWLY